MRQVYFKLFKISTINTHIHYFYPYFTVIFKEMCTVILWENDYFVAQMKMAGIFWKISVKNNPLEFHPNTALHTYTKLLIAVFMKINFLKAES